MDLQCARVSHLRTPTKSQSIFGGSGGATAPTIEPPAWRDDATEPPTPTEVASDGGSGGAMAPTIEPTEEVPSRGDEVPTIILPEVRDASTFAESTPEILLATIPQVIATSSASAASQKSETGSTNSVPAAPTEVTAKPVTASMNSAILENIQKA